MSAPRRVAHLVCGRRTKWLVLLFWVVLMAVAGPLAGKLTDVQVNDAESFLPGSAESTEVIRLQEQFRDAETLPAVVVYVRESGITEADLAAAEADRATFASSDELAVADEIPPPLPSEDGQALQLIVPLESADGFQVGQDIDLMRSIVSDGAPDELRTAVTGPAGISGDFVKVFGDLDTTLLLATAVVVIVILLITYRSPTLWLFPLLSVGLGLGLAQAVIYLLADNDVFVVNGQTQAILTVLVFGAGTDYALLLVARYREELRRFEDRHEAMAEALHKAGPAIIASAATVAIGLLCLLVSELQSTRGLGPVGAVGIVCSLFAMMTLLPALLVAVGRFAFWPFVPRYGSEVKEQSGVFARIGHVISRRSRLVWVATALVLGLVALNTLNLNADGLSQSDSFREKPDSVVGQELLAEHFPAGAGSPVVIIGPAADAAAIEDLVASDAGIAGLLGDARVAGDLVEIQATLDSAPDSSDAEQTVQRLRASLDDVSDSALVGGTTAVQVDVSASSTRDRNVVIPLVLVVVFVILMLLLRSLAAPLLLMATVILSFFATLGLMAFFFNDVFDLPGADPGFPLFAFIFLVALGIDYNIFLMTRVREESARIGTRPGVLRGLAVTGGVITSAGVVLAATFAVLMTLPLVFTLQIGLAVAVGVLLDAILVRSILVPALAYDIGRRIWWPSALSRRDVDDDHVEHPLLEGDESQKASVS